MVIKDIKFCEDGGKCPLGRIELGIMCRKPEFHVSIVNDQ